MIWAICSNFQVPNDTGPIYKETIMGRFPVEPFNTASNLVFLFVIIYFSTRVFRNPRKHLFLSFCMPILSIGFVGGTIFHGTRSHQIWLFMDWVPITVLCMSAVFYFIFKLYDTWWKRLVTIILVLGISYGVRQIPIHASNKNSIGYIITAITVLLPMVLYLIKKKGRNKQLVIAAFISFVIAISFRSVDKLLDLDVLYMGTHWLWHFFGGVCVFFLMRYIYRDSLKQIV